MTEVEENVAEGWFELPIERSQETAVAYYEIEDDRLVLTLTIVPERFSGQGIGSALARGVFETLRATGRRAVLGCPFMAAMYARHPEYSDVVIDNVSSHQSHG